jgi:hypothetical protein
MELFQEVKHLQAVREEAEDSTPLAEENPE